MSTSAFTPSATCRHAGSAARVETPLITDMVAAMGHLETAASRAGSPAEEARACRGQVTEEVFATWVLGNAERITTALDRLTAPYSPATAPF